MNGGLGPGNKVYTCFKTPLVVQNTYSILFYEGMEFFDIRVFMLYAKVCLVFVKT